MTRKPRSHAPAWERFSCRSAACSTFDREVNTVPFLSAWSLSFTQTSQVRARLFSISGETGISRECPFRAGNVGSLNRVVGHQNDSAALCASCSLTSRICAANQCVPNRATVIAVFLFQRALVRCMLMRCVGGLDMTRMLRPAAILVLLALLSSSGCASSSWHLRKESDSQYYERFWRRGNFGPRDRGGGWVMNPLYNPLYN